MSSESEDDAHFLSLFMTTSLTRNTSDSDKNEDGIDDVNLCYELQPRLSSSPNCVAAALSNQHKHSVLRSDGTDNATWPLFPMSSKAQRTHNPIRAIVDPVLSSIDQGNGNKPRISLALGDPVAAAANNSATTSSKSLKPCPLAIRAVIGVLTTDPLKTASYTNAIGTVEGRQAIAHYHSHPYYTYDPQEDIVIANGCSGALELVLSALLYQSDTETPVLLIPEPGFPLYRVIAEACGATVVTYPLCPEQKWEADMLQLHTIIQSRKQNSNGTRRKVIRGIVINNPSNPTGAVYSASHLRRIVHLCSEYCIPIVADEIYGDLVFDPHTFIPIAEIAAEMGRAVPVITTGGIGKQFLLPGWRIGWLCVQDNIFGSLQNVRDGVKRLAQIVLGASHLAQFAIPSLLLKNSDELFSNSEDFTTLIKWKTDVRHLLQDQAMTLCNALKKSSPYLDVIEPQGAMYAMVRLRMSYFDDEIQNDVEFMKLLLQEENVLVLPGTCFGFADSFRVVFCAPMPMLKEAANRIDQFCHRHRRL